MNLLIKKIIATVLEWRFTRALLLYVEHRGAGLADSITYRTLFSVFAGVLLGFSLAALWLGGNPEAMGALVEALDRMIPGLTESIDLESIAVPTGVSVVGVIALIGLIGAAMSAISSLRSALHVLADEPHEDQNIFWVLARNLLVAITFGSLLVLAAVLSTLSSLGVETVSSLFGVSGSLTTEIIARLLGVLVVFTIDTVAIALVFKLLSAVKAQRRALWAGAMLGGVGLTVLQELSSLFVRGATANPLFATFAALIALLLWFNLSAQVILIASCYIIVTTAETRDRVRERFGAETLTQYRRRRAEALFDVAKRELLAAQEAEHKEHKVMYSKVEGEINE